MTKKLFLTLVSAIFMFLSCGGNDSCTTSKSYGINSLTKKDSVEICYEKIAESSCYKNMDYTQEQIKDVVRGWQDKNFVFHRDTCKDLQDTDKTVKCPDFIPESFKFSNLAGCEIYSVDPNTSCDAPCYDLYFATNNDYFPQASFQEFGEKYIKSVSRDESISFSATIELNGSARASFSWSEKDTDGNEIKKGVRVEMTVVDPNAEEEPTPDTDIVPDEDEDIEITNE